MGKQKKPKDPFSRKMKQKWKKKMLDRGPKSTFLDIGMGNYMKVYPRMKKCGKFIQRNAQKVIQRDGLEKVEVKDAPEGEKRTRWKKKSMKKSDRDKYVYGGGCYKMNKNPSTRYGANVYKFMKYKSFLTVETFLGQLIDIKGVKAKRKTTKDEILACPVWSYSKSRPKRPFRIIKDGVIAVKISEEALQ